MKSVGSITLGTAFVCLGLVVALAGQQPAPKATASAPGATASKPAPAAKPATSHDSPQASHAAQARAASPSARRTERAREALLRRLPQRSRQGTGNLSLASFDFAKVGHDSDVAERMIRKMQASMMPPPGMPRPDPAIYQKFITSLETTVDAYAKTNPNPGGRTFQRLNRPEYTRADQGTARPRRRRRPLAAARHDERELRQHRRRAGAVADAARVVPERRRRHQPHGGGRQGRAVDRLHLHQPELHVPAPVGPRRGRAVRHARRHGGGARVPGRRRVRLRDDVQLGREHPLRGHRHLDRRPAPGAGRVRADQHRRRRRPRPDAAAHRAVPGSRRPAQGGGRVRPQDRRSLRRPDSPARLVVRRRRLGRQRHHHAAAHARPRHSRAA